MRRRVEVLSGTSGSRRVHDYRYYVRRRKGPACCTNTMPAPMADADASVLRVVKATLLQPAVFEHPLAYAESVLARDRSAEQREALEADLANCETAIRRLTAAIVTGGDLRSLVSALETYEQQRRSLEPRLEAVRAPKSTLDLTVVRRTLQGYLADWQGLLHGHVHEAQQVLRRLVKGRLTFTPTEDGYYTFAGMGDGAAAAGRRCT